MDECLLCKSFKAMFDYVHVTEIGEAHKIIVLVTYFHVIIEGI